MPYSGVQPIRSSYSLAIHLHDIYDLLERPLGIFAYKISCYLVSFPLRRSSPKLLRNTLTLEIKSFSSCSGWLLVCAVYRYHTAQDTARTLCAGSNPADCTDGRKHAFVKWLQTANQLRKLFTSIKISIF